MAIETVDTASRRANDFQTVEELGSSIQKIATLLQAAINTGADDQDDLECLMCIAREEAERAKAHYMQWAIPEGSAQ